ncbi:MAG: hypothetical protein HYX89_01240 [Chloroflexi bacterium]|nr:hypothetical protein [Chloroflexota bacterium]
MPIVETTITMSIPDEGMSLKSWRLLSPKPYALPASVFWFLGSAVMGLLYSASLPALVAVSVALELAAIPLFILVIQRN